MLLLLLTPLLKGQSSLAFLNTPSSATMSGLGGVNASLSDSDPGMIQGNPSLLDSSFASTGSVNYFLMPTGIGLSTVRYNHLFAKAGLFSASVQYQSYGKIDAYDAVGNPIGRASAGEFAVAISHVRQSNNFRFGGTMKFAGSQLAGYHSNALLFDAGALFVHPNKRWTVALSMLNFGFITNKFSKSSTVDVPFDIRLGTTIKPEHMPIRFSLTLHQLHNWDLIQPDEVVPGKNTFLDNTFRHVVFGAEILFSKNIHGLIGYNHLRRQELKLESAPGFSGFSVGAVIDIKNIDFAYAFGGYHTAGSSHSFSLNANISELIK